MRTPVRLASLAATWILIATPLKAQNEAEVPSRRRLAAADVARFTEAVGTSPFALLAARARDEPAGAHDVIRALPDEVAEVWNAALVCGLWSDDPDVALGAAGLVPEGHLDLADIDRWLEIVWPHVFAEKARYDWETFKHVVDRDQVARVLEPRDVWTAEVRSFFINDLHRSMRPEHLDELARLVHHDDPLVRRAAFGNLGLLSIYTNRHRDVIARELLAWPGPQSMQLVDDDDRDANPRYEPLSLEHLALEHPALDRPARRPGYSPLLAASLERWFVDTRPGQDDDATFGPWLLRWAEDERPGAKDRLLLRALLRSENRLARAVALRGLRWFGDEPAIRALLHTFAAATEDRIEHHLARAAAGDDLVAAMVAGEYEALAVGLDLAPDAMWIPWIGRAFGRDAEVGHAAMGLFHGAQEAWISNIVRFPDGYSMRLRQAVDAFVDNLDAERLHRLATEFPACRTERLAAACLEQLTLDESVDDDVFAMLEVHDEIALEERLVALVAGGPGPARDRALDLLMRLGSTEVGAALVERWPSQDRLDLHVLARSETLEVEAFLVEQLRALDKPPAGRRLPAESFHALTALAAHRGLPERTCHRWAAELADHPAATVAANWDAWRRAVVCGNAAEALAAFVASIPPQDLWFPDLGLVDDDAVLEVLRRARDTPGASVQWVTNELAIAGDAEAERTLAEVRHRALYGWMDDASLYGRTLGRRLDLMPFWIGEVETVCCRRNGAAWAIEGLTGFYVHEMSERGMTTQHDFTAAWWARVGEHLRYSRIVDRFVVAPH